MRLLANFHIIFWDNPHLSMALPDSDGSYMKNILSFARFAKERKDLSKVYLHFLKFGQRQKGRYTEFSDPVIL